MTKVFKFIVILSAVLMLAPAAFATNGDNLIGIGPIARSMGGVGIAAPQDAIGAVFANPAAMCFGPYCPSSEINFGGTLFMPHPKTEITSGGQTFKATSSEKVYMIPAIGVSVPISTQAPFWRFGLAAYGVTGLGVDYRGTSVDAPGHFFGQAPLIAGEFSELQIMKFAPALSCQPIPELSFGLAVHVDYASLDLRQGASANYGLGVQAGSIYKLTDSLSLGLNYVSPQNVKHKNVTDFDNNGTLDNLDLESPQQVGLGLAYTFLDNKLLLEGDVKWINWADANGYESFDWRDQWVYSIGAQVKPISNLALRVGYNYARNPVKNHDGFSGRTNTSIQGKIIPTYFFETFRIVGFPAIVEHHITCGLGYEFSPRFALNAGYMHAFEKGITERGTDITGQPVSIKSTLYEDSIDFGFTWRF